MSCFSFLGQGDVAQKPATVGSRLPSVEIDCGFPPEAAGNRCNILERTKGKRVIIVGLPGAFTPT